MNCAVRDINILSGSLLSPEALDVWNALSSTLKIIYFIYELCSTISIGLSSEQIYHNQNRFVNWKTNRIIQRKQKEDVVIDSGSIWSFHNVMVTTRVEGSFINSCRVCVCHPQVSSHISLIEIKMPSSGQSPQYYEIIIMSSTLRNVSLTGRVHNFFVTQ